MADSTVEAYYNREAQREWERMERHRTEFAVSLRAMGEYLPPPPARVLDIGGGPGRYAIALAQQGYRVTLLDLAQANLDLAKEKAQAAGVSLEGIGRANALDLSDYPAESFDAVLVMGPLYHLLSLPQRQQALREARRVLKPGGAIFAAFICRFAPLRDSARRNMRFLLDHMNEARRIMADGTSAENGGFTEAYFAHPNEIIPLMEGSGFQTGTLLATEGVAAGNEDLANALQGSEWEAWLDLSYTLAHEPALLGAADHLLYIGRKTGG